MARKSRVFLEDVPVYVKLQSRDTVMLFYDAEDREYFKNLMWQASKVQELKIHAYSFLEKSVEYLASPKKLTSVPKFMQNISLQYLLYYNKKYKRTGTIWDGRYKSSLVEVASYFFQVMSFIERKPNTLSSSFEKNYYDNHDSLIVYHEIYKELGFTQQKRIAHYQKIFADYSDEKDAFMAICIEKQVAIASPQYVRELEQKLGVSLSVKRRGRPKKIDIIKGKKMYKNLNVLDKKKHQDLKISPLENLDFARNSAFIPVVAAEVAAVGTSFPVVFSADENPSLIALVSLGGESLAVNPEGKWITQYVPSFLRKYPFSLASTQENPEQKVILIDEDSHLFSTSKGKQLFKKSGEQSEVLEHAITFLTSHEQQMSVTKNIAKIIAQSGILEDREISVGEGEEKKVLVNGFKVVDREKLNALSDDILADWVRKGIISFIDAHIKSLDNIQALFNIAHQRQN